MLENINPYNETQFREKFKNTQLYAQLAKDFDLITWSTNQSTFRIDNMTPRQFRGIRIFSAVSFYYFEMIGLDAKIYDIGCGWNVYKRYLPNLVGISADDPKSEFYCGDEFGFFDERYVSNNLQRFDNVIAMNSLHFIPLQDLQLRFEQLLKVTKPGGRIFVMMNVCHPIQTQRGASESNPVEYIRTQMDMFRDQVVCFELDDANVNENMSEGTLRIVLQA